MMCVYILGRDVVVSIENSSPPFTIVPCHCRLPHLVAEVSSALGEQVSEAYAPRVPAQGRGRIRFLGSVVAISR
jgi:hypothetical protein